MVIESNNKCQIKIYILISLFYITVYHFTVLKYIIHIYTVLNKIILIILSSLASKPINIRWIRNGSQNHVYHRITVNFPRILQ